MENQRKPRSQVRGVVRLRPENGAKPSDAPQIWGVYGQKDEIVGISTRHLHSITQVAPMPLDWR